MKTKVIAIILFGAGIFSCSQEDKIEDPIYEFASFKGDAAVNLGEATNSVEGYPLLVQLWAFKPYAQDITLNLEVTGTNAQKDIDFTVTPSDIIVIRAGKLVSDTIWIKTINNGDANELERTFQVKINTISEAGIKIGLGITEPENASVSFKIQDDECSGSALCVYNTTLNNTISGGTVNPSTGVVDKINSTVTVTGDLIDYGTFSGATLTVTLTPSGVGSTTGTATFGEQETGTDSDGYAYKFIEVGTGSYDSDAGTISVEYDIYYWDSGWVYWYSVTNVFSVP